MARQFKGKIALDTRVSQADWDAFPDNRAPKDAPNVLVILYDDSGQAAWSPDVKNRMEGDAVVFQLSGSSS